MAAIWPPGFAARGKPLVPTTGKFDSHVDSHFGELGRFLAVQRGRKFSLVNSGVIRRHGAAALRRH
jgi:hypothetical protein